MVPPTLSTVLTDRPQQLREALLAGEVLVADGSLATALYDKGFYLNRSFEELSLTHPEAVREVTLEFLRAGAELLTTNTFSTIAPKLTEYGLQDRLEDMALAAVRIVRGVAGRDAYVMGCVGPLGVLLEPLGPTSFEEGVEHFARLCKALAEAGVDGWTLQGFQDLKELEAAALAVRRYSQALILPHISVQENLRTNFGHSLEDYVTLGERLGLEVLGLAGDVGPSGMLTALKTLKSLTIKPIAVMPNAGLPRYVNDQYIYLCNPDYIGKYAKRFLEAGASVIGGHSGVGAQHIMAIRNAVKMNRSVGRIEVGSGSDDLERRGVLKPISDRPHEEVQLEKRSKLGEKLARGEQVVSVEIVPPRGVEAVGFFDLCRELEEAGVEFVNIPDGARAVARMSSLQLAAYVRCHFKIEPIPHFTARDRNLLGLQSDLLGSFINGVRNVLLVTGDPPKLGNTPGATGVYDVDAIGLTHILARMNKGLDLGGSSFGKPSEFVVGVAVNPTAANQELELRRFQYKVEAGANFAISQPIYDVDSYLSFFERLAKMPNGEACLKLPVVMGIWPLVSLRNAEFLKNEVPGVSVPDWVVTEMEKACGDRDEAVKRGLDIAVRTMEDALKRAKGLVSGFQISAPFNRVKVALEAIRGMRA